MPTTIGNYRYDLYNGLDLTKPIRIRKPRKRYPVPSDPSIYILEEDYNVLIDYYEPLKPSQRHSELGNVFWVKDTDISDTNIAGVGTFTRTWTSLPGMDSTGKKTAYVRSEYEPYIMTVPGLAVEQAAFQQYPVASYSISNAKHTIVTSASHDIAVGKGCIVYYQITDPLNKYKFLRQAYRVALTGTSGTSLVVEQIKDVNTVIPIGVQRANIAQQSFQRVVTSRVDYTYYLPTVDVNGVDDIGIVQPFFIVDNTTGARTELLGDLTTPSLSDYYAGIAAKDWFPVECIIQDWQYNENIKERKVRYVQYQM